MGPIPNLTRYAPPIVGWLAFCAVSWSVQGAVLYSQPFNTTSTGFFADTFGNQIADEFILATDSTVSAVDWFGKRSSLPGFDQTQPRPFVVRFFDDTGSGVPESTPIFEQSVMVGGVLAGTGTGMGDFYRYSAVLPDVSLVGGTQYWLQVMENDTTAIRDNTTANRWTWMFSFEGQSVDHRDVGDTGPWTLFPQTGDPRNLAFALSGVPEPSTLALLGLGLAGLGFMRRRRLRY